MKKTFLIFNLIFLNCFSMEEARSTEKSSDSPALDTEVLILDGKSLVSQIINREKLTGAQKISRLKVLLRLGFDINSNLSSGFTVLHYAVLRENPEVVDFLVKNGANPHIENCDSRTAYQLSIHHAFKKMREIFEANFDKVPKIYRPGMNREKEDFKSALDRYNKQYNLQLALGERFKDN